MRAVGATLGAASIVSFLALLMLIEAPKLRAKVARVQSGSVHHNTIEAVDVVAAGLRRYLWARTIVGIVTALLYVAWLWIFDVDLLIVWGLLIFLLNSVPVLGSLVSGIIPAVYGFFTKDFGTAAIVGGILANEQVMGTASIRACRPGRSRFRRSSF